MSPLFHDSMPVVEEFAERGALGVPLFFVISGYCMHASATSIIARRRSSTAFLRARFLRIYPPFWASIVVVLVIPFVIAAISFVKTHVYQQPILRWYEFGWGDWIGLASLFRVFRAQDMDLDAVFSPVNSVYWTLAIEFQFYLVMFGALMFRRYFYTILVSITICGLFTIYSREMWLPGLFVNFWPMFSLGLILHYVLSKNIIPDLQILRRALSKTALMTILVGMLAYAIIRFITGYDILWAIRQDSNFVFAAFCAVGLWLLSRIDGVLLRVKHESWLVGGAISALASLGTISYSLYLIHGKTFQLPWMFVRQVFSSINPLNPILGRVDGFNQHQPARKADDG
jgi:peptidoglycan/LPS O-acetylase OafA/YrhL